MSNFLEDGTVLPFGLLGHIDRGTMDGFAKTYRNNSLRIGVIIKTYPTSDDNNRTKLATEYDVVCIEQNEDKGATTIQYKNCLSMAGLGSIADFFESTLRAREKKDYKSDAVRLNQQDGTVVLLLCLDGSSDKGIILGGFPHPDRKTTLVNDQPRLEAEYNGVNIKVENDGSTTLTFKGATDNSGKPTDASQGDTVLSIEKDGTYQVKHKTITQRFEKGGKASLTADDDISNTTKTNFNVTTTKDVNVSATGNMSVKCNQLVLNAQGSASLMCQKLAITSQSDMSVTAQQFKLEAESMAGIKAPNITLEGNVQLGGQGGQPVLIMSSIMFGVGNLGLPVVSQAISGFATKVFAQ